jgi:serine phosphatase RsbU (regulator of sigma subunit)
LFEQLNLRLAQSVTARNALGRTERDYAREIATMLYGEIRPAGYFRFVNFGHPPPLVFSAEFEKFMDIDESQMVQFLPLGLAIPDDHPDRSKYFSMTPRTRQINSSDVAEIRLMSPGDILLLHTDGVFDGSNAQDRRELERVVRHYKLRTAKEICNAVLQFAVNQDEQLRKAGEVDRVDDKTAFVIKRK